MGGDNKVHRLGASEDSTAQRRTLCGMWGWKDPTVSNEFDTDDCRRFEALDTWRGVTCKRCLARNIEAKIVEMKSRDAKLLGEPHLQMPLPIALRESYAPVTERRQCPFNSDGFCSRQAECSAARDCVMLAEWCS